ncbi:sigma-E factor negative regulatory protein [uncultured Aggregatibacter sp.]|jgi:mclA|uniref:sigma-E factor negative regulatory protein n=1 Tax=uncultured Aggregatibacter sp. TaxID=470564 RepID=UPI001A614AFE|nr:sigma-E factor negative regulatory protein [uncultured Aggregatibacter sp.]VTX58048.1 Anti-sigma-E factor RseA [uncultured Aggregatibacter sp.]
MQKELLSAYMDGEQVNPTFTEQLCQDAELQESWEDFHTIRSIMRKESNVVLGADFTAKMESLIATEEIQVSNAMTSQPLPQEVENAPFMQKLKAWFMPITQVAVAASVCLVAVLGVQSFNAKSTVQSAVDAPVLQTLPFNNGVQEVSYNAPSKDVMTAEQLEQKNKRIGAMLQSYELQRRVYADSINLGQNRNNK